jgi:tetratricopeptide (TPR) repeat protein
MPSKRWSRRRRQAAVLALAALVMALALGAWLRGKHSAMAPPLPDMAGVDQEIVEAIQEARDAVLQHGSSAASWGKLGKVLLAHEFNAEANTCLAQAELLDPREPAWPYLQGLNLVAHDPDAGILCLERAAQRGGDRLLLPQLLVAEVLLERGRLDEAQMRLEQVLQIEPNNLRARLGLGRLAMLRQDWRAGLDHLQGCRHDVHTRKRACTWRAEALNQLGDRQLARIEQHQATELPADQPWPDPFHDEVVQLQRGVRVCLQAANELVQAGHLQEAVQLLRQTVEKYPNALAPWMQLGGTWAQLNRPDRAEPCFQRAVQLSPDMAEAWYRLGCMQAYVHPTEAAASFRQAIRLKPNHAPAHFNLGQCLLREQGDPGGAAAEFQAALRCRPDYDLAHKALRELEAKHGRLR